MSTQNQILSYCELFRKMFCPKTPVVFGFHAFVQAQPNTISLGGFLKVQNVLSKITGHDWMHFAMSFLIGYKSLCLVSRLLQYYLLLSYSFIAFLWFPWYTLPSFSHSILLVLSCLFADPPMDDVEITLHRSLAIA